MSRLELTRRRTLTATAGAAGTALAGCLGSGAESDDRESQPAADGTGEIGDPAGDVTITVASSPSPSLEPALVHVVPGGTVRWVSEGVRNTIASYDAEVRRPRRIPEGEEPFHSGLLRSGNQFERTFDAEGIYDYVDVTELCGSHETFGLVGRIVVGWPDLEGQPAIEHDNAELPGRAEQRMDELDEETQRVLG